MGSREELRMGIKEALLCPPYILFVCMYIPCDAAGEILVVPIIRFQRRHVVIIFASTIVNQVTYKALLGRCVSGFLRMRQRNWVHRKLVGTGAARTCAWRSNAECKEPRGRITGCVW